MLTSMNLAELAHAILNNTDPNFNYKLAAELAASKAVVLQTHVQDLSNQLDKVLIQHSR